MNPVLTTIESFQVAGLPIRTSNFIEKSDKRLIPNLWKDFFAQDLFGIDERVQGTPVYGVYTHYESDEKGCFDVIAGVKVAHAPVTHLQTVTIDSGDYLVFDTKGSMPERIIKGWQDVWAYFLLDDAVYQRLYTTDFEQMIDDGHIKIFIAVRHK